MHVLAVPLVAAAAAALPAARIACPPALALRVHHLPLRVQAPTATAPAAGAAAAPPPSAVNAWAKLLLRLLRLLRRLLLLGTAAAAGCGGPAKCGAHRTHS
jgi:hypothetical protein